MSACTCDENNIIILEENGYEHSLYVVAKSQLGRIIDEQDSGINLQVVSRKASNHSSPTPTVR